MKIGIVALGSHHERHGASLPLDTDARIAEHIAKKVAEKTDSEFLGTLKSAYELPEIETGDHDSIEKVIEEVEEKIEEAKSKNFEGIFIVNAHGGNQELEKHLKEIEKRTRINLRMDSTICNIEGPHAGTGELSMGAVIGITDESRLDEHTDSEKYPEVGFVGFEEAREKYEWTEKHSQEIIQNGVKVDKFLGNVLLKAAAASAANKVQDLKFLNKPLSQSSK